jgi:hypothetical protein
MVNDNLGIVLLNIFLCVLLIASVFTSILVIKAVYPFLVSGNSSKEKYHSHIFFNSVAEFTTDKDYFDSLSKQSDHEFNLDLSKQIYQLAKGLQLKNKLLAWAMCLVFFELAVILIILILIIIL